MFPHKVPRTFDPRKYFTRNEKLQLVVVCVSAVVYL